MSDTENNKIIKIVFFLRLGLIELFALIIIADNSLFIAWHINNHRTLFNHLKDNTKS